MRGEGGRSEGVSKGRRGEGREEGGREGGRERAFTCPVFVQEVIKR